MSNRIPKYLAKTTAQEEISGSLEAIDPHNDSYDRLIEDPKNT